MHFWACLFFLVSANIIFGETLQQGASEFICAAGKKNHLNRLAVFAFTDADGEETGKSSSAEAVFLSALASCESLTVIDKSKEEDILEELPFGQTGVVDPVTMVPVGQLTGADSLLFGIYRDAGLELRLLNARTGELLAARVFTGSGSAAAPDDADYFTKRWLVDSVQTQPPVYLYVTSSPGQWHTLCQRQPHIERYYNNLTADQQLILKDWRTRIGQLRDNGRLPQSHEKTFKRDAVRRSRENLRDRRLNGRRRYHTRTIPRRPRRQSNPDRR